MKDRSIPTGPVVNGNGISSARLLYLVLAGAGFLSVLVVILALFGDSTSNETITVLQSVMLPIITAMLGVVVMKLTAVGKAVNGITHELIRSESGRASAQATVDAQASEFERSTEQAKETAEITASVAKQAQKDAEARTPEDTEAQPVVIVGTESTVPVDVIEKEKPS